MKKYVLSIDAGTTGITIILLNRFGNIVVKEYSEFMQIFPKAGWVEHNAEEIWDVTLRLLKNIFLSYSVTEIDSIGITNQRETTVLWNKLTGKPIYNAIVWQCRRTSKLCDKLKSDGLSDIFESKTGLVIDSYFSATKIKWILDNVNNAQKDSINGKILFGTIDSWLLWKLTSGKVHATDFTNASRTLIYNIDKKCWDNDLLSILDIPRKILPKVMYSSNIFGETDEKIFERSIPISGIAGDQQAALFGQNGFTPNSIKNTYGTGCFLLVNTGKKRIKSNTGMINTLACDEKGNPVYAMEGSVFIGGAVIQWLRDELNFINNADESEQFALSVKDTGGVYMVPAFSGLGSPYWDMEARGLICGITRGTNQNHLVRAALESIAFQVKDLIDAIQLDLDESLTELKVDGGATNNDFLMQFQANILDMKINKPFNIETTATGAGFLAGLATGFWKSSSDLISARKVDKIYKSSISNDKRNKIWKGWKIALERTITRRIK